MKWNVGFKISLGYALALASLVIIGVMSYTTTLSLTENVILVEKTKSEISILNNLVAMITDAESSERGYVITGSDGYLVTYNNAKAVLDQDIQALRAEMHENSKLTDSLNELETLINKKMDTLEKIVENKTNNRSEQALSIIMSGSGKDEMDQIRNQVSGMTVAMNALLSDRQNTAKKSTQNLNAIILFGIPFAIILVVITAMIIVRSITKPLKETTLLANKIALGELDAELGFQTRQDEIGDLSRAFAAMNRYLRNMAEATRSISIGNLQVQVEPKSQRDLLGNALSDMIISLQNVAEMANLIAKGDLSVDIVPRSEKDAMGKALAGMLERLKEMADVAGSISSGNLTVSIQSKSDKDVMGNTLSTMITTLREITSEIIEGVNVIASVSSEIMASTVQVASSAMETSAAIIETTSSVEQVKQSALMASDKARIVSEVTKETVQTSEIGRKSVEQSVLLMGRIQNQVESISQSLVRLSEQSQAIGEIISSVNDLAEQSNLLAVNAAIEAAKAGEQGKGFTVVAQEVKVLAEQSKEATAQVRMILNDILKAISSAVLTTEQGAAAVTAGVTQSREAGETIQQMADGIGNAAQMAVQITVASQQQLAGMDQIAQAMENIRQASEQNVEGTKQVEDTVQNLHALGQRLKQTVEQYKI